MQHREMKSRNQHTQAVLADPCGLQDGVLANCCKDIPRKGSNVHALCCELCKSSCLNRVVAGLIRHMNWRTKVECAAFDAQHTSQRRCIPVHCTVGDAAAAGL